MELLYVWIENYKNIHLQGFNFSPAYRFDYKLVSKNDGIVSGLLTEKSYSKEKDVFYKRFFNDSSNNKLQIITNFTAIIGQNGAGKSNLINFLHKELASNRFTHFYIYKSDSKIFLVNNSEHDHEDFASYSKLKIIPEILNFSIDIDTRDQGQINNSQEVSYRNSSRNSQYNKLHIPIYYGTNSKITMQEQIRFITKLKTKKNNKISLPFHTPNSIELLIDHSTYIKYSWDNDNIVSSFIDQYHNGSEDSIIRAFWNSNNIYYEKKDIDSKIINFCNDSERDIHKFYEHLESGELKFIFDKYKILETIFINFYFRMFSWFRDEQKDLWGTLLSQVNKLNWDISDIYNMEDIPFYKYKINIIENFFQTISNWLGENNTQPINGNEIYASSIDDLEESPKILGYEDNKILSYRKIGEIVKDFGRKIDNLYSKHGQIDLSLLNIDYADDLLTIMEDLNSTFNLNMRTQWNELSYGEESFLKLCTYFFHNMFNQGKVNESNAILIFIDEGETGFHPEWQRNYLNYLITFFNQSFSNKQIQFILSSHSPFLASDLPKENIVFLRKGKIEDGNFIDGTEKLNKCLVVDRLNEKKQTFGANIHTLFTDSFFMEDLIGKFAKEKIDNVIATLNKSQCTNEELEYCQSILNIIGEPILKSQLQKIIDSKKLRIIDNHEERIKFLEEEIDKLKGKG